MRYFDQALWRGFSKLPHMLPWEGELAQIVKGIILGLAYLHERKIFHRDLKPDNVLIENDYNPILCDFGISKQLGTHVPSTQGGVMGTGSYIAPELYLSEKFSEKSDVFSVVIMLWELTCRKMFNNYATWQDIVNKDVRPPLPTPDTCPPTVVDLMQKCCSKVPADRPTTPSMAKLVTTQGFFAMPVSLRENSKEVKVEAHQQPPSQQPPPPERRKWFGIF